MDESDSELLQLIPFLESLLDKVSWWEIHVVSHNSCMCLPSSIDDLSLSLPPLPPGWCKALHKGQVPYARTASPWSSITLLLWKRCCWITQWLWLWIVTPLHSNQHCVPIFPTLSSALNFISFIGFDPSTYSWSLWQFSLLFLFHSFALSVCMLNYYFIQFVNINFFLFLHSPFYLSAYHFSLCDVTSFNLLSQSSQVCANPIWFLSYSLMTWFDIMIELCEPIDYIFPWP